jgi:hypothetical protein
MKIGRNDACPCGSGKKYKKCCEAKDAEARSAALAAEAQAQAELALAAGDDAIQPEKQTQHVGTQPKSMNPPKTNLPANRSTVQKRKV